MTHGGQRVSCLVLLGKCQDRCPRKHGGPQEIPLLPKTPRDEVSLGEGTSWATTIWEGTAWLTMPRIIALSQVFTPHHGYVTSSQGSSEWHNPFSHSESARPGI